MAKTGTALDKNSYFKEIAKNIVPAKYKNTPVMSKMFLFASAHFLKRISATT